MWWGGGQGGGTWNWTANPALQYRAVPNRQAADYYTTSAPRNFWTQAGQAASGGNAAFEDFWGRNFDRYFAQYTAANEQDKNLLFPDWLNGNVANDINTQFQLQAPGARGIDRRLYDPGRFDTSY